ncbi:MAG: geranylgeranylglycerol-phosphate geranylgeranyltransferase [Bacteroidales bacterium]|nr:geranylgeranylglycerol-phosphate geranylgeranyltransferase [Bacteroidales bacterium]
MKDFLKLIRLPNLLIIPLVQYSMRYCIIEPILQINGFELQLSNFDFLILVLSTVFLAAAGYIINDYFDRKIDMLNRPSKVIVGKKVNQRTVMIWHILLNIFGVLMGIYLAYITKLHILILVYFIVAGLFWYYSTTYKRQFLIGNIIVSFLASLVPLQVVLYEIVLLNQAYKEILIQYQMDFTNIVYWVGGFSYFAFISNLIREIIKDTEDFEGDNAYGRNTMPVIIGIPFSKFVVIILILFTNLSLAYIYHKFLNDNITFWYFLITLIIPFFTTIYLIIRAINKRDYHIISTLVKFIMLFGILYSFIARYLIIDKFNF